MPKLKCVTAILGLTLCCAAKLGAQAVEGAGYDPVAVRLGQNVTMTSRPVAPMDLLTLRDPKGVGHLHRTVTMGIRGRSGRI